MTKVSQPPARHANVLARRAAVRVCAMLLIEIALIIFALRDLPWHSHVPALLPLGIAFLVCSFVASRAKTSLARARVGARSERRVASALKSAGATAVLNSLLLGAGGDADHVVLGPCLVVIETKTGRGPAYYKNHQLYVAKRPLPGNPVSQVQRQARALRAVARDHVDAIVCVVDMQGPPFTADTATVCSLHDLPAVMRRLPVRLDAARAERLYDRLLSLRETAAPTHDHLPSGVVAR